MAEFINPFSGVVSGHKLTKRELTRAIRMTLSAEEEAVHLYEALADATTNKLAKGRRGRYSMRSRPVTSDRTGSEE